MWMGQCYTGQLLPIWFWYHNKTQRRLNNVCDFVFRGCLSKLFRIIKTLSNRHIATLKKNITLWCVSWEHQKLDIPIALWNRKSLRYPALMDKFMWAMSRKPPRYNEISLNSLILDCGITQSNMKLKRYPTRSHVSDEIEHRLANTLWFVSIWTISTLLWRNHVVSETNVTNHLCVTCYRHASTNSNTRWGRHGVLYCIN